MPNPISRLRLDRVSHTVLRNVVLGFVVIDLLVLAAFSVRVDTVTRTTSIPAGTAPAQVAAQVAAPSAPLAPAPVPASVPLGSGGVAVPIATEPSAPAAPAAAPTAPTAPAATPSQQPTPPPASARTTPCPIDIASSESDGGLQSLIDFAPAFGPFSAEAFAMASAYQPALQLIGPILAKYPALAPTVSPLLDPLLRPFERLLDTGFALLGPLYGPYRQRFLESETRLAAALAPYAQKLATSALGGCVVALQNALLHDTSA
ncbi:MAG: hypothetical protein J7518_01450 [Nocardioidaceae bacterium]|nr:hypothetical protein [Nocardioidaceae bacterium]